MDIEEDTRQGFEKVSGEGNLVLANLEVAQSPGRLFLLALQSLAPTKNPHSKDNLSYVLIF